MTEYTINQRVLSDIPCKICGEHELEIIALKGRHFQTLTTAICTNCGLVHSHPIPTKQELDDYYKTEYRNDYKGVFHPKPKHILRYSHNATRRLQDLLHFTSTDKKLLDVGSGSGEFVYLSRLTGFDVQGLEPHEGYSEYTRTMFDADIITAALESATIAPETYDIITLHHVLEHLQFPLTSLCIINNWLKKDGILAVEVPNIETTQHSPTNRYHYAHIYNFNHHTLKAMLHKAGFDIIDHPQFQQTSLYARKAREPNPTISIAMPQNYAHLSALLSMEEAKKYYKKQKPLLRLLRKWKRYIREYITVLHNKNAKDIVMNVFNNWQKPLPYNR